MHEWKNSYDRKGCILIIHRQKRLIPLIRANKLANYSILRALCLSGLYYTIMHNKYKTLVRSPLNSDYNKVWFFSSCNYRSRPCKSASTTWNRMILCMSKDKFFLKVCKNRFVRGQTEMCIELHKQKAKQSCPIRCLEANQG